MKASLIGNCQIDGIARCIAVMQPSISARGLYVTDLEAEPELQRDALTSCDVIFVQTRYGFDALKQSFPELVGKAIAYPLVHFPGFHPDMTYVRDSEGNLVETLLSRYNSKLTLAAYVNGLEVERAVSLFASEVFDAAGYFSAWAGATSMLATEYEQSDIDLGDSLSRWARRGCFMYTMNHPRLLVLADIARAMLEKAGQPVRTMRPETYAKDSLQELVIWPVYPEIAAIYGLEGDYCFKPQNGRVIDLEQMVRGSYASYAAISGFQPDPRLEKIVALVREVSKPAGRIVGEEKPQTQARSGAGEPHPHSAQADHQVWKLAVASVPAPDVDPVVEPKFRLSRNDKVATFGSCFAQHISHRLQQAGLNYLVAEQVPAGISGDDAARRGYGVFSARYGNIYTARQFKQLLAHSFDEVPHEPAWRRPDGRYVDVFRPLIEPDGFATPEEVVTSRQRHLRSVRELIEQLDVAVFTLGLTEAWQSRATGAVLPVAPGVVAGRWDPCAYDFVNFGVADVAGDLADALDQIKRINPRARVIVTVSPVPLIATYEERHVLVSTTASKAVLRVAAEEVCRERDWAYYFPSYEIVSSPSTRGAYFEANLRSVTPAGVDHVMRLFLRHLYGVEHRDLSAPLSRYDVICDEESLAADGS